MSRRSTSQANATTRLRQRHQCQRQAWLERGGGPAARQLCRGCQGTVPLPGGHCDQTLPASKLWQGSASAHHPRHGGHPSVGGRPPMPASTPRRSPLVAVHSSRHRLGQDPTPQVASRCRDMAQASACDPTGCQPAWAGPLSRGPRVFCSRCTGSRPAGWVNAMSSLVETLSQHTWQRWLRWSRSHCAGTCPCNAPER